MKQIQLLKTLESSREKLCFAVRSINKELGSESVNFIETIGEDVNKVTALIHKLQKANNEPVLEVDYTKGDHSFSKKEASGLKEGTDAMSSAIYDLMPMTSVYNVTNEKNEFLDIDFNKEIVSLIKDLEQTKNAIGIVYKDSSEETEQSLEEELPTSPGPEGMSEPSFPLEQGELGPSGIEGSEVENKTAEQPEGEGAEKEEDVKEIGEPETNVEDAGSNNDKGTEQPE